MATGDINACIDCRWCRWPEMATGSKSALEAMAMCWHPSLDNRASLITGERGFALCTSVRAGECGVSGAWFEPRKGATGA